MASVMTAHDLRGALLDALEALRGARGTIDAVNVYPVPDADTGTNLVATFESVERALAASGDRDVEIATAIAEGALRGARGNSGIIIAQVLRSFAEAVTRRAATARRLGKAFAAARATAREAVLEPAEGTILSVLDAAADAAQGRHPGPGAVFAAATSAAIEALDRTPSQMKVLADNGVVDAGGMGLVVTLGAMARALGADPPAYAPPVLHGETPAALCAMEAGEPRFRYEVQYMVATADDGIPALRRALGEIGDSVAVIGGRGSWRVHVHTDEPEQAVALGASIGGVTGREDVDLRAAPRVDAPSPGVRGIEVAVADARARLVALIQSDGAEALFRDLGAVVIDARDRAQVGSAIRAELERDDAHTFVVPNSEDMFGLVQLVLEDRLDRVTVLRTGDMAHGLAAAVAFGDARSVSDNLEDMNAALRRVRSGQVVLAPQATETPIGTVVAGQPIGFVEGRAVAIDDDPIAVLGAVGRELITGAVDAVSLLCGAGVDDGEAARAREAMARAAGSAELEVHVTGQPVHRYVLAVE